MLLGAGFADGFGTEASAEPTVQSFLLDWQQGNYGAAAAFTNGGSAAVSAQLAAAYTDLDASNAFFAMDHVTQHGDTAVATYRATVDLAQAGKQWTYVGTFGLSSRSGHWVVDWTPSVINPRLAAGERLAVVTAFPQRAGVEDMDGQPLIAKSPDYQIGVYPGELKNPEATAAGFASLTGLDPLQVLGQIQAAPPGAFLSLLTLDPGGYGSLWPKLARVPGLQHRQQDERLFNIVRARRDRRRRYRERDDRRNEGAAYAAGHDRGADRARADLPGQPGRHAGHLGRRGERRRAQCRDRCGAPPTAGPACWSKTTLSAKVQGAADSRAGRASRVRPRSSPLTPSTGAIRAVATRTAGSVPLPQPTGR